MNKAFFAALPLILLTACASFTLFDATVTTTEIVDEAMRSWAELSVAGKTTPQIDEKVIGAHFKYQQSAAIARNALVASQAGNDQAAYQKAFEATRVAMYAVLDIILPLLQPAQKVELQSKVGKAVKL